MRILFASSSSGSRGGGELYLITLAGELARRGHEVVLWASTHPRMDELAELFAAFGKVVRSDYTNTYDYRARCLATCWNFATSKRIAEEWRKLAPDIIHVNKQNLEDGLDLLRAAEAAGIPNVCTIHLTQNARYLRAAGGGLRDFVASRALGKYRGTFIVIQETRARELEKMAGSHAKVVHINNGVQMVDPAAARAAHRDNVRRQLEINDSHFLVAGLGRMSGQKRPLLFLDNAVKILAAIPEARFLWIGDGPMAAEWDAFVAGNGLEPFVTRLPWQSHPGRFLSASDLFMHVAEYESFLPLAMLEAMSMRLPCALTENLIDDIPFLKQAAACIIPIREGWTGKLRDRALLDQTAAAGRKVVEDHFSMPKSCRGIREALPKCITLTPHPRLSPLPAGSIPFVTERGLFVKVTMESKVNEWGIAVPKKCE